MGIVVKDARLNRDTDFTLSIDSFHLGEQPTLLLGANGAGKSTLLGVLAQQLRPEHGRVESNGRTVLVEQFFRPIKGFSAREYCAYVAWLRGEKRKVAVTNSESWLDFVGLGDRLGQPCEKLSGGQKSRLAIATALNSGAQTLLLDEPSAALDPQSKQDITALYVKITQNGQNLAVSTHDAGELQDPFIRIIVMDRGRIDFDGSRSEFLAMALDEGTSPSHRLARTLMQRRQ